MNPALLSLAEQAAIRTEPGPLVSAVSIWEARLKWQSWHASGTRKGVITHDDLMLFIEQVGWTLLPLSARHAAATLDSPVEHKDPFDELLLVQAQVEGLRLLTRDRMLVGHPLAITAQTAR